MFEQRSDNPNQYLTFLASGTGGGAIAPEVSPLISSASESDVGLAYEISTALPQWHELERIHALHCLLERSSSTAFVRVSGLARRKFYQTLLLPLYVVLVFFL